MNKIIIPFVMTILLISVSCKKDQNIDCYEKELKNISFGFETSLEDWKELGGNGERAFESDIEISTDNSSSASKSVKFTVSPNSIVNSGVRSELTFDPNIQEGDEIYLEYSMFIPNNYQDVYLHDSLGKVNWQLMGQWHDQPDECIGQTWNTLPSQSPPVGIYYSFLNTADPSYDSLRQEAIQNEIFGFDSTWNNVSVLTLSYNKKTVAIQKINKGEWVNMKFHIKWSTNSDGFIQSWINGNSFTNGLVYGKNMWNKASHYFKFGLYRNPNIEYINSVYYDEFKIYQ